MLRQEVMKGGRQMGTSLELANYNRWVTAGDDPTNTMPYNWLVSDGPRSTPVLASHSNFLIFVHKGYVFTAASCSRTLLPPWLSYIFLLHVMADLYACGYTCVVVNLSFFPFLWYSLHPPHTHTHTHTQCTGCLLYKPVYSKTNMSIKA